jgi:uncharacterized protein (DUF1697 family)
MIKYVAFLRSINVGGRNLIKMKDLKQVFHSMGLANVQTYIQSGNISFDSESDNLEFLKDAIESHILSQLECKVNVLIRTYNYINQLVRTNPFRSHDTGQKTKCYVCFLDNEPKICPGLPLINHKERLELIRLDKFEAFILSKEVNGRFGFPNNFIEKELNVISTARNWTTLNRIVEHIEKTLRIFPELNSIVKSQRI